MTLFVAAGPLAGLVELAGDHPLAARAGHIEPVGTRTTDATTGIDGIAIDFPLGHGPRLTDEPTAKPARVDLGPQSGRRHPKSGCRLSESEHLADVLLGVDGLHDAAAMGASDLGDRVVGAEGSGGLLLDVLGLLLLLRHLDLLGGGGFHTSNVDATAYVVNTLATDSRDFFS
jgi:hypothetical protein